MTPDEKQRAKAILEVAISRPENQRRRYVLEGWGDNARLRADNQSRLANWNDPLDTDALSGGWIPTTDRPGPIESRVHSDANGRSDAKEPDLMFLPEGAHVGPYRISSVLGSGSMGVVYLARDTRLDRDIAMKVLPAEFAADVARRRRFEFEARAVASLNHPNIVSVHDAGLDDGIPFIVMEFVRGETLSAQLRRGRMSLGRSLQIGNEIAAALVEAHEHKIAHRDLKPANVMVMPDGRIKVLDFGIAKAMHGDSPTATIAAAPAGSSHTLFGQLLGTPGYMSPEQLLGRSVDARTDLYSLGVILFELVTGHRAFEDREIDALRRTMCERVRSVCEIDPSIPPAVADVIARAMAFEPSARQTAAVLKAELNELMARSVAIRPDVPSVAVLSFTDMSSARDQEFFCDGIADELINALTQISGLRVAARTSAFQFKGKARDVRVIGDALNVATVLDGSVRKSGDRIRVTVELIGSSDGYQLWSERFDRGIEDIFAVQEEIASSVVNTLKGRLAVGAPAVSLRRRNLKAYASYLEGRYHWNKRTEDELTKSVLCFERAIEGAPDYAEAYAGLADAYVTLGTYGAMHPALARPLASAALEKALAIDGELAEAYACRGSLRSVYLWSWQEAEQDYRKAIALRPAYATAHQWHAINHLVPLGRFAEASTELQLALDADPLALAIQTSLGMKAYFAGQYDEAVEALARTIELEERFGMARFFLGATYTEQRKYFEAREELEAALNLSGSRPEILAALGYLHGLSGETGAARAILNQLTILSRARYVSPGRLAQVHIGLSDHAAALDALEQAHAERAADLAWLGVRPVFASLRGEPRFDVLLRDIGVMCVPESGLSTRVLNLASPIDVQESSR